MHWRIISIPTRIIVSADLTDEAEKDRAAVFAELLRGASHKPDVPVLLMGSTEAEAVKLFSNTYLSLCGWRISMSPTHMQN